LFHASAYSIHYFFQAVSQEFEISELLDIKEIYH